MNALASVADPQDLPETTPHSLAELVLARGLVAPDVLARARRVEAETGERLVSVLTRLGLLSEQVLATALCEATGLPLAGPQDYPTVAPVEAAALSPRFLRDAKLAVLRVDAALAEVACADPLDPYPAQAAAVALQRPVRVWVGRASDVEAALERTLGAPATTGERDAGLEADDFERLKDLASDAPAIRAVNRLIAEAVERRASDLHLEPTESGLKVRMRIDGVMQDRPALPPALRAPVVSRIKVMAALNIAERRLPQDGRLRLAVRGREVDLRVATSPTLNGEGVVLRLLDRSNLSLDFAALGFPPPVLSAFRRVLARPHGIVLVTGPTGSGKTSTLYTALSELNSAERKLLTIEDPIEYRLEGVNQTQAQPNIGLGFAAALRSFLRQDPDVMMVGEIRDLETAQVAVQAALTGHVILSTLHTNSAAAAVTRLIDMGVEPFLITSTVSALLGQRLVRRLCPQCREPADPIDLGPEWPGGGPGWRAVGCVACDGAGFRGRLALVELLVMDDAIARLVLGRAEAAEIEAAAVGAGMATMLRDGADKAAQGLTTPEEVLRVVREAQAP